MRLMLCILSVLFLFGGCRRMPVVSQPSASEPVRSSSSVSSQVPPSVVSQSAPVSSLYASDEIEIVDVAGEEKKDLREWLWINFEKKLYGAETDWLYIWVNNKSTEPVYVMQTYQIEKLAEEGWAPIGEEKSFDNPNLQLPVEPEESRLVGVYMGWLGEWSARYEDNRIPAGDYRVKLTINRDLIFDVPFSIQEDPLEPDNTLFELRSLEKSYAPDADAIKYELINKTDHEIIFSYACQLEKWDGEVWKPYPVPGRYPTFVLNLRPGESVKESYSLSGLEEPLEKGKYRLVKTVVRSPYYAEFEVSDIVVHSSGKDGESE